MLDQISNQIGQVRPEFLVFIISMLPITELRLALPLALTTYHIPLWQALPITILGNWLPSIFFVYFLGWIAKFLSVRSKFMANFFTSLFEKTHIKHSKKFELWGALALITFVAIPLPMTGAWTGALVSFVFEIDKKKAIWYLLAGICIASIIVGALTLGIKMII
ncbi:ligand-binding protein SH3 [Candidatus Berkelbacteria bacterium CG_4_9_14_3_um_filter_39_23]|uniref:Ligand-binding protein SH3 n=2 Tax=Candidatus Berkelbacteria TaxID=1618330 RepID=A0A2M7CIB5_9BACT|nr:small multi-drug export protein [Candidatus Berkelbacteria bacterium]OIP04660.1 MAG: hypothetical protein AUK14_02945 [Candidatus Berkelbacteria bacterium CG2_30_39_44]PIR27737.1 MAG: ligand-binding protein SH3 [Candidatus Berkelbacteria bacterium CG11_big_fil_rev_8_21_14_0_20_40_23]PIV25359.1 MAG: ligand-binding protein SH3 [Candidatus Berkelbacteria bacterium CG03_land_8_20_14_0_80_40_36]PIZ28855.1 MAG: ligand-binding protein SH3 [Candidatus Berkelbacteria bacterium CG_4_10_14_0_8_um_filte